MFRSMILAAVMLVGMGCASMHPPHVVEGMSRLEVEQECLHVFPVALEVGFTASPDGTWTRIYRQQLPDSAIYLIETERNGRVTGVTYMGF